MAREIELLGDREQARQRLSIWAGSIMPHTIVAKEVIDNALDVINERKQPATKCVIKISENRMRVMDNGTGLSTEIKEGTEFTHLWLACAKMFSSSNYGGVADSLGANGVGLTTANYTSHKSSIINFNGRTVKGYTFTDGYLDGAEESTVKESGDLVDNPLSYKIANEKFNPEYEHGFLVDLTWDKTPNEIFRDPLDLNWLVRYTKLRTGELNSGEVELYIYNDDGFKNEIKSYKWQRNNSELENYVKSWDEKVEEYGAVVIKDGDYKIAMSTNPEMKIDSMIQGAPIKERFVINSSIEIQDYNVKVSVPYSIKYVSTEYPPYTDQTKCDIRLPYTAIGRAFEKSGDVYKHFYREAEKAYMSRVIKDSNQSMFWPSLGKPEESELIIAEGFSAISGVKAMRDPMTQACIALRGKISNVWNLDMVKAMNSDVVKQILNAVLHNNYKRIIIATDADDDGYHIASLLIALFNRFTNVINEGKLYYLHTPKYIFKKGKDIAWSDNFHDCPKGYSKITLKGLGSLTPSQTKMFITNPETRTLQQIVTGDENEAWNSLNDSFSLGGEKWIIQ